MGVYEAVILQRITDPVVEIRNTWYIGGLLTSFPQALSSAVQLVSWYLTHLQPVLSNRWSLYGLSLRDVSIPGTQALDQTITGFTGLNATDLLPPQLAATVFWKTGTPAPNRKWVQISGWCESTNGPDGQLNGPAMTALDNFAQEVLDHNSASPDEEKFVAAHWDRVAGRVNAANALVARYTRPIMGTQRRRIIGRGI